MPTPDDDGFDVLVVLVLVILAACIVTGGIVGVLSLYSGPTP